MKIDTVIPGAQNIFHKEQEKVDKYQDPSVEVHKMWNVKGTIIFVIINTLGTVSNSLGKLLDETVSPKTFLLQKTLFPERIQPYCLKGVK